MIIGYISHYNRREHYGFIDSPDLDIDIYFHMTNCNQLYKRIFIGDKVSFEFNPVDDQESGAKNVSFIQNNTLDDLKIDFKKNRSLKGYLKKIENSYYVKDLETYIYIHLKIEKYEKNIQEVYEDNLNQLIDYKIIYFSSKNKIKAINTNRQYLSEYKLFVDGKTTEDGLVVATVNGGYKIKTSYGIIGFLPNSLATKSKNNLEKGTIVNVTCINKNENLMNLIFDLTENLEDEINLNIEQEKFIASLMPGDKFLGKIKNVKGFGVFISFGLSEGLLHLNKIIDEPITLSKLSRKEFSIMFEKVFHKGKDIDIIIEDNIDNRISLTWDKSLELNKNLYKDIYNKFKTFE